MFGGLQSRTGVFVELPQPTEKALPQENSSLKPTAILRNSRGLALEIYNPAVIAAIINTIGFASMVTFNAANAVFTAVIAPEILGTIVMIVPTADITFPTTISTGPSAAATRVIVIIFVQAALYFLNQVLITCPRPSTAAVCL